MNNNKFNPAVIPLLLSFSPIAVGLDLDAAKAVSPAPAESHAVPKRVPAKTKPGPSEHPARKPHHPNQKTAVHRRPARPHAADCVALGGYKAENGDCYDLPWTEQECQDIGGKLDPTDTHICRVQAGNCDSYDSEGNCMVWVNQNAKNGTAAEPAGEESTGGQEESAAEDSPKQDAQ